LGFEQWVQERVGGYIRLSVEERREAVKELTDEGMSGDDIAEVLGVGERTVDRDRAKAKAPDGAVEPSPTAENALLQAPNGAAGTNSPTSKPADDKPNLFDEAQERELREKAQRSNLFSGLGKLASLASIITDENVAAHHVETLLVHWDQFHVQERRTLEEMHEACVTLLAVLPVVQSALDKVMRQ
jgi:transposase